MASALIPFDSASNLPAELASFFAADDNDLGQGVGAGFPSISIKGKVFHLVRGDERTLITKPGADDEPASALEVVILKANPILSHVFYNTGYVEGSDSKPTCYSNDGVAPAADAEEPQSLKCATCPHAQWGAKITDEGKKAKACQDSRRIAVAPLGQINDPMLVRVPAASLKTLKLYGDECKKRGLKYSAVGTKISFDHNVAHPALTFKPMGMLPPDLLRQVMEVVDSDIVRSILGMDTVSSAPDEFTKPIAAPAADPAPKKAAKAAAAAAIAAAAAPKATMAVSDDEDDEPAPVIEQPKPAKAKAKEAKPTPVVAIDDDLDSQLSAMLSGGGFEDDE